MTRAPMKATMGAFEDCSDTGKARRGTIYDESITVFLPK